MTLVYVGLESAFIAVLAVLLLFLRGPSRPALAYSTDEGVWRSGGPWLHAVARVAPLLVAGALLLVLANLPLALGLIDGSRLSDVLVAVMGYFFLAGLASTCLLLVSVTLFNRPRLCVPRTLRGQEGLLSERRFRSLRPVQESDRAASGMNGETGLSRESQLHFFATSSIVMASLAIGVVVLSLNTSDSPPWWVWVVLGLTFEVGLAVTQLAPADWSFRKRLAVILVIPSLLAIAVVGFGLALVVRAALNP